MSSKRSWSGGLQTTSEGTLGVVFGASFGFVDVAPRCTAFASWHVSDSVQFVIISSGRNPSWVRFALPLQLLDVLSMLFVTFAR